MKQGLNIAQKRLFVHCTADRIRILCNSKCLYYNCAWNVFSYFYCTVNSLELQLTQVKLYIISRIQRQGYFFTINLNTVEPELFNPSINWLTVLSKLVLCSQKFGETIEVNLPSFIQTFRISELISCLPHGSDNHGSTVWLEISESGTTLLG